MNLKEIVEVLNVGYTHMEVVMGEEAKLDRKEQTSWTVIIYLKNGKKLHVDWSGYMFGYSEYTPSCPGHITFEVK